MATRAATTAIGVLLATVLAGAAAVTWLERGERAERRREAEAIAEDAAASVEDELERTFAAAHALGAIVRQAGRIDRFEAVAEEMLRVYPGASALQLAPDGVIREVHPLAGNEAAVGLDLFAREPVSSWARRARDSRALTVQGPFQLAQGGLGLVGRLPVFRTVDGEERFWGFTAVVVRLEKFLGSARVDRLEARGYAWTLATDDGAAPFAASAHAPGDPVRVRVRVPNATWVLAAAPAGGFGRPWTLASRLVLALGLGVALALLAHRKLREPELLARLVSERTRELEEARAGLERELAERLRAEAARRAAEDRLLEMQKLEAIGQLAGGVAHDFNNLLVGIIGYADLLADAPQPSVADAARGIRQAAERAATLTRQLLGLARRGKFVSAPVDVVAVVREVAELLGRTLDKGISVEVRGDGPATVLGDAGQLHQVVLNLAVNARDAMPHGGRLVLEIGREALDATAVRALPGLSPGRHVVLRVSDTGTGIPEELRGRIFEPFFTTKEVGRGTGLGLAMAYGIVRNHGGAIGFTSLPGAGTTFTLHLPSHDGAPAAEVRPEPDPRRGRGAVLVVDDEPLVRNAAVRMLAALGYEARGASGAAEATALLRDGTRADVALVDLVMPGEDGVACLAALRRERPALAAVLSSGYGEDQRVQDALAAGFSGFLYKPYGKRELAEAIEGALVGAP
jgi:signal transduction histidine kinase